VLELHGDSVFASGDYRRALNLYRQSSQPPSKSTKNPLPVPPSTGGPDQRSAISTPRQATLRLKECQCHIKLEECTIALRELEAIPVELRDVKTNACLGRLYKNAGLRRHAITTVSNTACFICLFSLHHMSILYHSHLIIYSRTNIQLQLVVQSCPLAIECVEMLAALGVKQTELPVADPLAGAGVEFLPMLTKSICSANSGHDGEFV
jgi:hypothetical protein